MMVPIQLALDEIDEDASLEDTGERWRRFGWHNHVGLYSKNGFISRMAAAGFDVQQYGLEYFGLDVFAVHGISEGSVLYIVAKPRVDGCNG